MSFKRTFITATTALLALAATAQAAGVSGQGTWETTLQPRDINNDGKTDAFYDTVLKVTWLADANAGAGSVYDSSGHTTPTDGLMTWADAKAWAANLNVYGATGWRLPTLVDTGAPGCDFAYSGTDCGFNVQTISADGKTVFSEMAYLFYVSLGNKAWCDTTGDCTAGNNSSPPNYMLTNTGAFTFSNLKPWAYWSGVPYAPSPSVYAWHFRTGSGFQDGGGQHNEIYALAVRPGDVSAPIPEPQTLALMLLGLGAVALAARRRAR
jgi:PEP-CTERM motif